MKSLPYAPRMQPWLLVVLALLLFGTFARPAAAQEGVTNAPPVEAGVVELVPPEKLETSPAVPDPLAPDGPDDTANYAFSTATTGSLTNMSSGTTTLVAANQDDTASSVTAIGFDFYFQGARYAQFSTNSNGLIRLGGTAVQGGSPYQPLAQASQALITPYGADQRTHTSGKVHFKIIGTAPNRVLVVEWLNMQSNFNTGGTADLTYQARLYETSGVIEFVYGSMTMSALGAASTDSNDPHIGFSSSNVANTVGSVTAPYSGTPAPTYNGASATPTANLYNTAGPIPVLTSAADGARRTFTFTPTVPAAPTSLTFSGVTASAMTLNWVDAPTELGYAIYNSTDGTNFTFVATTAANVTTYAATGLTPSTTYFWRVFAFSEGALSTALTGSQATTAPGNVASVAAGGLWSAPATWVGGVVPTSSDNVTIVDGATVTVDTAAVAYSLTVGQGASGILQFEQTTARTLTVGTSVTIAAGGTFRANPAGTVTTHALVVGTSLTNNGTLDFSTNVNTAGATITFTGVASATFGGTGATTDVRALTINKGTSSASVLEVTASAFTVRDVATDVAGFLTLTNGTFKLSGTFSGTNRVFTSATYTIPATAGFWLNNPNYTVAGQAGAATVNGLFRLTQGTFNVGTAAGNAMDGGTGAQFVIEGGALNAASRFAPQNAVTYTQSGGTVTVNTVSNATSAFGSFELFSTASVFNMSGGTIVLLQASTAATTPIDYQVRSTTVNITGGTLQVGAGATTTNFNFRIIGNAPNLVIDNTTNAKTVTAIGTTVIYGNLTVNSGTTLNLNGFLVAIRGATITNNGAVVGTVAGSRFYFFGTAPQSYGGSGTLGTPVSPVQSIDFDNPTTVTLNAPSHTFRVILFQGTAVNSNQITLGNGAASATTVQIGVAGGVIPGGTFDVSPTYNTGTGGHTILYVQESVARTTGFEIPPSRTVQNVTSNNTNGVTLAGGNLTVNGTLTLTAGRFTLGANTLRLGSAGTVSGTPSATNMVVADGVGPFCKDFAAAAGFTFPIGDATGTPEYSPALVTFTSGTFPGDACARVTDAVHPNKPGAAANYLTRYWTVTSTVASPTYNVTFTFVPADVVGDTSMMQGKKYDGGSLYQNLSPGTLSATQFSGTGLTTFSDFTAFDAGALAVTLANFEAVSASDHVQLAWETALEQGNLGFHLYRSTDPSGPGERITGALIPSQAPGGQGAAYSWADPSVTEGTTYFYWLEAVDTAGRTLRHGPVSVQYEATSAVTLGTLAVPAGAGLALPLGILALAALGLAGWRLYRRP